MNTANLSVKRPIFIVSLVIIMLVLGFFSMKKLGVDLLPPTDFPVVTITTTYPGADPEEIEKLVSKPLEEQVSTISGVKRIASHNLENVSWVIVEFTYETDIKYAEQKVREKVALAKKNLPTDLPDDPLVKQFDLFSDAVVKLAIVADNNDYATHDIVNEKIKPILEQITGVGEVKLIGAREREIQIELDRNKLREYQLSALGIVDQLKNSGVNVPVGKFDKAGRSTSFQTVGEFSNINQIRESVISFSGDYLNSVTVDDIAEVKDSIKDPDTNAYFYFPKRSDGSIGGRVKSPDGAEWQMKECIIIDVFKQSGANSVAVVDNVVSRLDKINEKLKGQPGNPKLVYVFDTAKYIKQSISDTTETIVIGIILAVLVVYLFIGNIRSTIITGIALPNSIIGAFVIMYFMGFTVNMMTLMALSLSVGLLVDDAIVVRENIYRKMEGGLGAKLAAIMGTKEVMLAVIATSLTIIAVFMPIGFLSGVVGRIFRQFGFTVVFAIVISLFDGLFVAPLLSAYFGGKGGKKMNFVVAFFDRFQNKLIVIYEKLAVFSINRPIVILLLTGVVFISSCGAFIKVGKTFQPQGDECEYKVSLRLPSETSLARTDEVVREIAQKIGKIPEICYLSVQSGTSDGLQNEANIGVFLLSMKDRERSSFEVCDDIRKILSDYKYADPSVNEFGDSGGGKPYILTIKGDNIEQLEEYCNKVIPRIEKIKDLTEVTSSHKKGKPQMQIILDDKKLQALGVNQMSAGMELRYHVEGGVVAKLHENGLEYDIRTRLLESQRDLKKYYAETNVPNIQGKMIPLKFVSERKEVASPSKIIRENRSRTIQLTANIADGGAFGSAIAETRKILEKDIPMPQGITYDFIGQANNFEEMKESMLWAFGLSIIFIFLVLASLYESFITPFTILLALPPALSGAAFALLFSGKLMDMFSMIGMIMLLGIVTKNSILLVDFALENVKQGMPRKQAIVEACKTRLRPILMTSLAMIAGTIPMALGLGEAAQYRQGMGIAIIGGLIVSTLITLLVVPAVFEYIDIFREFLESKFRIKEEAVHAAPKIRKKTKDSL
ncbi:MAG: efflux RND transporter permease subunit [Spirochaetes bacterium]|nr:efflux RND transporter permease subunit [Spirochaetota bacterium]